MSAQGRVLVAGCGLVGRVLARQLHGAGWQVTALTHAPETARQLAGEPFRVIGCDINDRDGLSPLGPFEAVVSCVSSGRGGAEAYRRVYWEGMGTLIETFHPSRLVFAGSTSVYAQKDGSAVTEESPALPDRETGHVLRETEDLVLHYGGHVVRLAGIYATGRWVLLERFLRGEAVIGGNGSRIINQIHRDDAAGALALMLGVPGEPPPPRGIYNATDGHPVALIDFYTRLAAHFDRPIPPFGPIDPTRKRGNTSKRVMIDKIRALGWQPRFTDFRDVLLAERHESRANAETGIARPPEFRGK